MSSNNSSKKEREEVMLLYHSDGAIDLIAGAVLLNLGLDLLNESPTTSLFTWIPILLFSSIKNRYSLPRIGYDALKANEKIVRSWTAQTAVGLAIALLLLGTLIVGDPLELAAKIDLPWQGSVAGLTFAILGGLGAALAAWRIPLKRLYIYAGVLFFTGLISHFFLPLYAPVFVSALVMLVTGLRFTSAFNKKYPDPEKDSKALKDIRESKNKK